MRKAIAAIAATLVLVTAVLPASAELYIDIVSSPRKLPVAIMELEGPQGGDISDIIKNDLSLSSVFLPMDPGGFTERKDQDR